MLIDSGYSEKEQDSILKGKGVLEEESGLVDDNLTGGSEKDLLFF